MKSILMSIQPKWVEKIISGEKTIEVRKTAPKEVPFKVYIYCTYGGGRKGSEALYFDAYGNVSRKANGVKWINGKVIGEFVCDKVDKVINRGSGFYIFNESKAYTNCVARQSGLYFDDLKKYLETKDGYAWHITDLKVYDEPKELGEFETYDYKIAQDVRQPCPYKKLTRPPQSWQYIQETVEEVTE